MPRTGCANAWSRNSAISMCSIYVAIRGPRASCHVKRVARFLARAAVPRLRSQSLSKIRTPPSMAASISMTLAITSTRSKSWPSYVISALWMRSHGRTAGNTSSPMRTMIGWIRSIRISTGSSRSETSRKTLTIQYSQPTLWELLAVEMLGLTIPQKKPLSAMSRKVWSFSIQRLIVYRWSRKSLVLNSQPLMSAYSAGTVTRFSISNASASTPSKVDRYRHHCIDLSSGKNSILTGYTSLDRTRCQAFFRMDQLKIW